MNASDIFSAVTAVTIGLGIGAAPGFWVLRRERRLTRLARARLEIAKTVTEMERLMSRGTIRSGHVLHDHLFLVMQRAQAAKQYPMPWNFFRSDTKRQKDLSQALKKELEVVDCALSGIVKRFVFAYTDAFYHQHPFLSWVYGKYLGVMHPATKGALTVFKVLISARRDANSCRDEARQTARFELTANSGVRLLEESERVVCV